MKVQDHESHSVVMSLWLLLIWSNLWVFLFHDTDIFEEHRPIILWNKHQFRFVCCFFMIRFNLCTFGRNTPDVPLCPFQCCIFRKIRLSIRLQLAKLFFIIQLRWSSPRFSTLNLFYYFVINIHLTKIFWSILLLLKFSPLSFSIHLCFLPKPIITMADK